MEIKLIGKYEILSTLGKGSMGVVYKARDPEIGRIVAIKTLRAVILGEGAAESEAMQRFKQESRSAGKLQHPNIVTIYEAGRAENGSPYIVMEHLEGESLEDTIAKRSPLDPLEALHYIAQVASAVDYAHRQNVIHRDIKPSNVIVDSHFRPFLLDFGVAKLSDTSLTPAGTVVGTPSYMSPEQIRGEELDGSTDLFALAVVAYELFTGKRPFPGNDFTSVVSNIIHNEPLTFAQAGIDLPLEAEAVFHRALSKDRRARYRTGLEFADALAKCFSVLIDGEGLVGGFSGGMRLADIVPRFARKDKVNSDASKPEQRDSLRQGESSGSASLGAQRAAPIEGSVGLVGGDDALERTIVDGSIPASAAAGEKAQDMFGGMGEHSNNGSSRGGADSLTENRSRAGGSAKRVGTGIVAGGGSFVGSIVRGSLLVGICLIIAVGAALFLFPNVLDDLRSSWDPDRGIETGEIAKGSVEDNSSKSSQENLTNDIRKADLNLSEKTAPTPGIKPPSGQVAEAATLQPVRPSVSAAALKSSDVAGFSNAELAYLLIDPTVSDDVLRAAVQESARRNEKRLLPFLLKLSYHPSYIVRVELLKVMGSLQGAAQEEISRVAIRLLNDNEFLVRGYAARILSANAAPEALIALEERAKVENNEVVQKIIRSGVDKLRSNGRSLNGGSGAR